MNTIFKVLIFVLSILIYYGCQRDFEEFNPQGLEVNKNHREQDAIKSLFERSYKHGELRSLKPQGMLDYSDFTVHWEHPVRDTLRAGSLLTVAYPIDMANFSLPISPTLERKDVERHGGAVVFPRLYYYRNLQDNKELFCLVVLLPNRSWLERHKLGELGRSVRVPEDYEGSLEVYSVTKKLIERYHYKAGKAVSYYNITMKRSELRGECIRYIRGSHVVQNAYAIEQNGQYEIFVVASKVSDWGLDCGVIGTHYRDDYFYREHSHIFGGGGISSLYDSNPKSSPLSEEQIKKNCEELKKTLASSNTFKQKMDAINKYRKETPAEIIIEMGYAELSDNSFVELKPIDGHSMSLDLTQKQNPKNLPIKGYMHNHTKTIINNRLGKKERSIQVFSPADLFEFHDILRRSTSDRSTLNPSDVYAVVIAEKYAYVLRVNGASKEEFRRKIIPLGGAQKALEDNYINMVFPETDSEDDYPDLDNLGDRFAKYLQEYYPLDGLILQRINLDTNGVTTIGFSAEGNPMPKEENGIYKAPKTLIIKVNC